MSTQEEYEAKLESKTVSAIVGQPTMRSYEKLINELKPIAIYLKTTILPMGRKYGFLATICTDEEYGQIINKSAYVWQEPQEPEDYDSTITIDMPDVLRKKKEEENRRYINEYNKYQAVTNVLRERIVEAVDEEYIEALKDNLVDYNDVLPFDLLAQIKKTISLTTYERNEVKKLMALEWDTTTTVRKYSNTLDANRKTCVRWGIKVLESDLIDHFVAQMYKHGHFEMKTMAKWENMQQHRKNWEACKNYFIAEAEELQRFNKSTAKQMGYHSGANVEEEDDDDEATEKVNMVFEMMQKNAEEMNAVAAANSGYEATIKGLEATITEQAKQITKLIEMNNVLVASLVAAGKEVDEKQKAASEEKKVARMCKYCKQRHWGAGKKCFARKCNKDKRPANWTGVEVDE